MAGFRALALVDIIRAAITRYLQSSPHTSSDLFRNDHVCSNNSSASISEDEIKDVELVHFLLLSAEKIGSQQFDCASIFLDNCDTFSSTAGNSVQRLVHYFSKALRERFNLETGRITSTRVKSEETMLLYPEEIMAGAKQALIACHQKVPFYQVASFAGIQAVIENVASARRIHIIDLAIRTGLHCTALMQAFATRQGCPTELLKITRVVGTTSSQQKFEEIDKRLAHFAETLSLPFQINTSKLTDIKDYEINEDEVVAVYSTLHLSRMTRPPDCLETFLTVLRKINPCVMVVIEHEANDLQTFEDRFFEALFHFGATFDCLEVCMNRCDPNRMIFEELYLGQYIGNIIAKEGEERFFGHMKIDGWRDFFNRFGLVEKELSSWSLFQAELVLKNFACGSSCTFDRNGECLIIGWKGTPNLSLSVWKFQQE